MRSKDFAFIIILIISGELYAEEKPCGLPRVKNGRIALYYYTFESFYFPMSVNQKVSFSCLAGHTTLSGKQEEKTVCTAEGWSPEPWCFKKCTKPDLTHGHIPEAKLLYTVQEGMRYRCNSGYKTPGGRDEEVVHCLAEGWSSPPACRKEQETCVAPDLHHGNYSTAQKRFRVKDRVRYQCDPGYFTAGGGTSEEAECHSSGWSLPPKCAKLNCPSLRSIENSYFHPVKQAYEEGDVVQFFCNENYYLSGSDLIQCYNFGWYPESPVCEGRRSRCPPPPLPPNSKMPTYSATYHHGEAVRIECDPDFEIRGSDQIRCHSGTWTEPPKCVEVTEKAACGQPPLVENGAANLRSGVYYSGDTVAYGCQSGYDLRGPKEITCTRGNWTRPPECVANRETCKPPPDILHGAVVGRLLVSYAAGSSVEYKCHQYYLLKGEGRSRCQHGQWSAPPVCLEPCTVSEEDMESNHMEVKWKYAGKVLHGDLIDFVCKEGFDLSPSTPLSALSVQCDRGHVEYPRCVRKESKGTCASPPLIANGDIVHAKSEPYENGSLVEYRCLQYYFLQGSKESYCLEGVWTAPPSCLEPCRLSFTEMQSNNLLLKWSFDNRPWIIHGEHVEFVCRGGSFLPQSSGSESALRVVCDRGQLHYPRCVLRESSRFYHQEALRT
ncbi:coagulation factor XIII B chain isoform X1 [Phyllostomus hastatus]|uniref:coagulation factor XIII B chain isoform X1 n=1 Tax=Phyllostomus hastatus TaxID=9423 RepID=UPI001E680E09|nr:coagulation factor XIII B chain isoform X1 [Phyllostomus hastatus]